MCENSFERHVIYDTRKKTKVNRNAREEFFYEAGEVTQGSRKYPAKDFVNLAANHAGKQER
jgi:hypothetical protein